MMNLSSLNILVNIRKDILHTARTRSESEANQMLVDRLMETNDPGWFRMLVDALSNAGKKSYHYAPGNAYHCIRFLSSLYRTIIL